MKVVSVARDQEPLVHHRIDSGYQLSTIDHQLFMKPFFPVILALLLGGAGVSVTHAQLGPNGATASFRGSLPPKAVSPISGAQRAALERELDAQTRAFITVKRHPRAADADIFLKA